MKRIAAILAIALPSFAFSQTRQPAPIPVKVVVVTMFERGADTGDQPGEFQYWVERAHLDRVFDFPAGGRNLRMNNDGLLALNTGEGTAKAAAAIMALGLDPRFDLTHAYWIVAGIAGIDPEDGPTGSAVWADWVVDGDLAHEIDAREIPPDWPTGYVPLYKTKPYESPRGADEGPVFRLLPTLVDWAFALTKDMKLADNDSLRANRAGFASHAGALQPPHVLRGDVLSASTYWHGRKLSEWANAWVKYYTNNAGNYVTTAMEDSGTLQSLALLDAAGRVDKRRVLVLRTGSNFDEQRDGITAPASLAETRIGAYTAFLHSLEAAYQVGNVVVSELLRGWPRYRETLPGKRYPELWFAPVAEQGKPDWEILPQAARSGEVILSKRNELGLLSNFAPTPFEFHGKRYASLEGFWQMMLYPEGDADPRARFPGLTWSYTRDQVAHMTAFDAKNAGTLAEENMRKMGIDWVTFEGKRFAYRSAKPAEHYALIVAAMREKVRQNENVRQVLLQTGDLILRPDHIEEPNAPPEWHYYEILTQIRTELQRARRSN